MRRTRSELPVEHHRAVLVYFTMHHFGRSYTGEPDRIGEQLAQDAAVQATDTILLTVPSQLGVDYNAAMRNNRPRHRTRSRLEPRARR